MSIVARARKYLKKENLKKTIYKEIRRGVKEIKKEGKKERKILSAIQMNCIPCRYDLSIQIY
jgi:hypothetical protein